jgi:beta-glucanase (GH16 family)
MDRPQPRTGNVFRSFCNWFCFLSFSLGLVLLCAGRPALAQDPQPPATIPLPTGATAWELIFNDNFDGTAYDTSHWNPYANWGGNGSFNSGREKYYPSQIRVADGICNLVAEPNSGATTFIDSYKSGELISARANTAPGTPYKFSFLYGYIEARLKIVNVSGFFGAFWMLPDKNNDIAEWEIDILEVLGHDHRTMFQAYHYRPGLALDSSRNTSWTPNQGTGNNGSAPVLDYSTAYHTYGLDWQADHLAFYIDGIKSGTFPTPGIDNTNIPRTPGHVLIQQMVENSWIRATGQLLPDPRTSVDTFHVDYVRVWQGTTTGINKDPATPGLQPADIRVRPCAAGWLVQAAGLKVGTPIAVCSMTGRTVLATRLDQNRTLTLRAENFPSGIYFLQVPGRIGAERIVLVR